MPTTNHGGRYMRLSATANALLRHRTSALLGGYRDGRR